jgi:hypothetical protein
VSRSVCDGVRLHGGQFAALRFVLCLETRRAVFMKHGAVYPIGIGQLSGEKMNLLTWANITIRPA